MKFFEFQIFIKYDKTYTFKVNPNTSIKKLKKMFQNKTNVPINYQNLLYDTQLLRNGKISDYNIKEHSTIWIM